MPRCILIAGGGVAAVETVAALRALAGPLPHVTLLTPEPELTQRPAAVAAPFGLAGGPPLPLEAVARRAPFELRLGTLAGVEPEAHVAVTAAGARLEYDTLV